MKQISSKQDKVHLALFGDLEDFAKGLERVLSADRVTFGVPDVVVSGEKDAKGAKRQDAKRSERRSAHSSPIY